MDWSETPLHWVIAALTVVFVVRAFIRRLSGRNLLPSVGKAILITGCDSGFGKASVFMFSKYGYVVFAGCLDAKTASSMYADSKNVHTLQIDVTNAKQVEDAAKQVSGWLDANPAYRLTAIVNNAGIALGTHTEIDTMDSFELLTNVNVFGTIRVSKAFLPLVRRGGRGGRIVMLSSMAAHVASPGMAGYCASKAGLLAFTNCLRLEVEQFGISVSSIHPDFYATEMVANVDRNVAFFEKKLAMVEPSILEAYGGEKMVQKVRNFALLLPKIARTDITPVMDAIADAVGGPHPQQRYHPIQFVTWLVWKIGIVFPKITDRIMVKVRS